MIFSLNKIYQKCFFCRSKVAIHVKFLKGSNGEILNPAVDLEKYFQILQSIWTLNNM